MAVITVTAAQVGRPNMPKDEVYTFVAHAAIEAGDAVYQRTDGKVDLADADDAGKQQFRGIALVKTAASQPVTVMKKGMIFGFDVQSLDADARVYVSDTAGKLDTAAGTLSVTAGRVMGTTDINASGAVVKVLFVDADWNTQWA